MKTKTRNWTTVADDVVARIPGGRDRVARAAARLHWEAIPEGGSLTVGFMPGEAINSAIRELEIPKVSKVAIGSIDCPGRNGEDGFYPGLYGIEGNYKDGRARVYILDTGTSVTPVFSDFWPKEDR
jgi:hypothetical protein